jgi:hypothetical protein
LFYIACYHHGVDASVRELLLCVKAAGLQIPLYGGVIIGLLPRFEHTIQDFNCRETQLYKEMQYLFCSRMYVPLLQVCAIVHAAVFARMIRGKSAAMTSTDIRLLEKSGFT